MKEKSKITLLKKKANPTCVEYMRELKTRVESGRVIGLTVVEENSDGTYAVGGSSIGSRTRHASMFLDAAITRLLED